MGTISGPDFELARRQARTTEHSAWTSSPCGVTGQPSPPHHRGSCHPVLWPWSSINVTKLKGTKIFVRICAAPHTTPAESNNYHQHSSKQEVREICFFSPYASLKRGRRLQISPVDHRDGTRALSMLACNSVGVALPSNDKNGTSEGSPAKSPAVVVAFSSGVDSTGMAAGGMVSLSKLSADEHHGDGNTSTPPASRPSGKGRRRRHNGKRCVWKVLLSASINFICMLLRYLFQWLRNIFFFFLM